MKIFNNLKYIILLAVIVLSFVIVRNSRKNYFTVTAEEAYELSLNSKFLLRPNDLINKVDNFTLVDLRDQEYFNKSHFSNAISIPFYQLGSKLNYKFFKNQSAVLLYSDNISESVKARLILNQLGFMEIYVLDISKEIIELGELKQGSNYSSNEDLKYKFQPDSTIKLE